MASTIYQQSHMYEALLASWYGHQQALPLRPELVVHVYNGQPTFLANGSNPAIPLIPAPPAGTIISDALHALDINCTSPLGVRIKYVDVRVCYTDLIECSINYDDDF